MAILHTLGVRYEKAEVLSNFRVIYKELKQVETAHKFLKQAIALFEEIGSPCAGKIKEKLTWLQRCAIYVCKPLLGKVPLKKCYKIYLSYLCLCIFLPNAGARKLILNRKQNG
jgi:hypothetical protein